MKLAMDGFATVARHEFISRKYDAIGKCQEQLQTLTGEQEATQITVATYTMVLEQEGERSMQGCKDIARPMPLRQLTTPPLLEEAKEMIKQHGCEIVEHADHCVVTFPEGTRRAEIFPRLYNERYTIMLPDGFQIREMFDRCQEQSLLFLRSLLLLGSNPSEAAAAPDRIPSRNR